jgi:hypothetical protein
LKAKVNSKISPVERLGISTPARSRGSNRNSRLQKEVQVDQEAEPALRFARGEKRGGEVGRGEGEEGRERERIEEERQW